MAKECLRSLRSVNLNERTRALKLMNQLILYGDIILAYQINFKGPLNELVREVLGPKEKIVGLGVQHAVKVLNKY